MNQEATVSDELKEFLERQIERGPEFFTGTRRINDRMAEMIIALNRVALAAMEAKKTRSPSIGKTKPIMHAD